MEIANDKGSLACNLNAFAVAGRGMVSVNVTLPYHAYLVPIASQPEQRKTRTEIRFGLLRARAKSPPSFLPQSFPVPGGYTISRSCAETGTRLVSPSRLEKGRLGVFGNFGRR